MMFRMLGDTTGVLDERNTEIPHLGSSTSDLFGVLGQWFIQMIWLSLRGLTCSRSSIVPSDHETPQRSLHARYE